MHDSRIVITGVGALSPNGVGRERYFAAVAEGRSGIRAITQFDASSLPCRVAGEVPCKLNDEFDPSRWVDAKDMKHVSRVVPLAIAAADEALRDAQLDPLQMDLEGRRNFAVMLGSGLLVYAYLKRMGREQLRSLERGGKLSVTAALARLTGRFRPPRGQG